MKLASNKDWILHLTFGGAAGYKNRRNYIILSLNFVFILTISVDLDGMLHCVQLHLDLSYFSIFDRPQNKSM